MISNAVNAAAVKKIAISILELYGAGCTSIANGDPLIALLPSRTASVCLPL